MGYLSPTLAVRDMKATIDFYVMSLNFKLGMTFPSPDNPEYADLSKDGMVLMFIPASNLSIGSDQKLGTGVNLYLQIDGDIDEYYDELKKRGVKIAEDIKDEPYGIRDFTVNDVDGYMLTFNQSLQTANTCTSCEVPMTANCQSCGMPMVKPEDFGGGNLENKYCVHCTYPDGSLKSYDEALEGMTNFMMKMQNMDRETAEKAAREYMSNMPAWSSQ
jgi:uncharacterized glyoxalase superfamily protein PhnB